MRLCELVKQEIFHGKETGLPQYEAYTFPNPA